MNNENNNLNNSQKQTMDSAPAIIVVDNTSDVSNIEATISTDNRGNVDPISLEYNEYRNDLNFYTNGRSVCITELKGYQETSGEPVFQPRRPNSRLDKIRHMFQKIM